MQNIKALSHLDAELKFLSKQNLVSQTLELVKKEKELTLKILHYFREISGRRLFAELGYSSLFEFAVKHLDYSAAAAQRRIEATHLLTELPEVEEKVKTGALQLSTLAMTQSFFKQERKENNKTYTKEQKKELISELCGKTTREVEKVFVKISPTYNASKHKDPAAKATPAPEMILESRASLDQAATPTSETATHKNIGQNTNHQKATTTVTSKHPESDERPDGQCISTAESTKQSECHEKNIDGAKLLSRYIPINIKRALFARAQNRCEYISTITNTRCSATSGLQIEHVRPYSCGGANTIDNLKIFCPTHNRLSAIKFFGKNKMAEFIRL